MERRADQLEQEKVSQHISITSPYNYSVVWAGAMRIHCGILDHIGMGQVDGAPFSASVHFC